MHRTLNVLLEYYVEYIPYNFVKFHKNPLFTGVIIMAIALFKMIHTFIKHFNIYES